MAGNCPFHENTRLMKLGLTPNVETALYRSGFRTLSDLKAAPQAFLKILEVHDPGNALATFARLRMSDEDGKTEPRPPAPRPNVRPPRAVRRHIPCSHTRRSALSSHS